MEKLTAIYPNKSEDLQTKYTIPEKQNKYKGKFI